MVAWQHSGRDDIAVTSCLVGDLDAARASACAERLRAVGAPATAFPGAAESTVDQVLGKIPKGALCLAYLDPYNLQYLSFKVIEKLARLKFVDFAVHFSTMDLRRNVLMEYNPERARFDDAAPGWRQHVDLRPVECIQFVDRGRPQHTADLVNLGREKRVACSQQACQHRAADDPCLALPERLKQLKKIDLVRG